MTNRQYFEAIVNSNLDDETKSLALSVMVNSREGYCRSYKGVGTSAYSFGVDNSRVDEKASIVAIVLDALSENGEMRCKEIAQFANDKYFTRPILNFIDIKTVVCRLVDCGVLRRNTHREKVMICRDFRGETLHQEIMADVSYFELAED